MLKDDDYENEKNQDLIIKIEQVIKEKIVEKENVPEGLEYYRTAYDFQQKQLESLKQERDYFTKRQQELNNAYDFQQKQLESLKQERDYFAKRQQELNNTIGYITD